MFVKRLIDKVSRKATPTTGLTAEDLDPRLAFHYGVPSGAKSLAYDPVHRILALSTDDGRIKLFGSDGTQALLESPAAVPSKFLQFVENKGVLLSVNTQNQIEVWDIASRKLSYVHMSQQEITAFTLMQRNHYLYVGNQLGDILIFKLEVSTHHLTQMPYSIPFLESHGARNEMSDIPTVMFIMPQPTAETRRVLIIFSDGMISLWGLQESKMVFITGGTASTMVQAAPRTVSSACWACPMGSKVFVGYDNGDILLWNVPPMSELKMGEEKLLSTRKVPLLKLNLGYKLDKVPVVSLRWIQADEKAGRLYVNGVSANGCSDLFQVVLVNESAESRTIKLVLPLPDSCQEMEIISNFCDLKKQNHNTLVILLKSGQLCVFDDFEIEKYLSQSASKSEVPKQMKIKMPYIDSRIMVAIFSEEKSESSSSKYEDSVLLADKIPCLFSLSTSKLNSSPACSLDFIKTNSLYITGHQDGAINFWNASCLFLFPILSIKHTTGDDCSSIDVPITALYFGVSSQVCVSGNDIGLVNIFMFRTVPSATDNIFSFTKGKGESNYIVHTVKLTGSVASINMHPDNKHLAIGTDRGYVYVIEMETMATVFQKHFASELFPGIISMLFEKSKLQGCEKNILLVAGEDSSVVSLEVETGLALCTNTVRPKKTSRALFMKVLGVNDSLSSQPLLLHCSENAVRLYFLNDVIQGYKKVYIKKKMNVSCCWAATFSSSSYSGLILVFINGKIEIRSLPELSLLKETALRGLIFSSMAKPLRPLCSSTAGEIVMVREDQELFLYSVLLENEKRFFESAVQVYKKDVAASLEKSSFNTANHKEKKGLLNIIMRDAKGNKAKQEQEKQAVDFCNSETSATGLLALFSSCNFPPTAETSPSTVIRDDVELDIDDIDIDDTHKKPKEQSISLLNRQLRNKINIMKGKFTSKLDKHVEPSMNENEKAMDSVVQIKKRYGYPLTSESNIMKQAGNKLNENLKKLQSIGLKTTEMQSTASSFSSTAKEMLRVAENGQ